MLSRAKSPSVPVILGAHRKTSPLSRVQTGRVPGAPVLDGDIAEPNPANLDLLTHDHKRRSSDSSIGACATPPPMLPFRSASNPNGPSPGAHAMKRTPPSSLNIVLARLTDEEVIKLRAAASSKMVPAKANPAKQWVQIRFLGARTWPKPGSSIYINVRFCDNKMTDFGNNQTESVPLPGMMPKDPTSHFEIRFDSKITAKVYLFEIKSWMDETWKLLVDLKETAPLPGGKMEVSRGTVAFPLKFLQTSSPGESTLVKNWVKLAHPSPAVPPGAASGSRGRRDSGQGRRDSGQIRGGGGGVLRGLSTLDESLASPLSSPENIDLSASASMFPALQNFQQDMKGILSRGLDWRGKVPEGVLEGVDPGDIKRQHALFEFVEKEALFNDDLHMMIDTICENPSCHRFLQLEERRYAFETWKQLATISGSFTSELRKRQEASDYVIDEVGDLCLKHMGRAMRMTFTNFIVHKPMISSLVEDKRGRVKGFQQFLDSVKPRMKNLDFEAFLLLPIQQVTRYPLLLERIKKYTPVGHVDYEPIQTAYRHAIEMTTFANEQQRFAELQITLVEIEQRLLIPEEFDAFSLRGDVSPSAKSAVSLLYVYDFQWMKPKDVKDKSNPRKVYPITSAIKLDVAVKGHNKGGEVKTRYRSVKDSGARKLLVLSDTVTGSFAVLLSEVAEGGKKQYVLLTQRIPIEVLELMPQTLTSHVTGVEVDTDIMLRYETVWLQKEAETCYIVLKATTASKKKEFVDRVAQLQGDSHNNIDEATIKLIRTKMHFVKSQSRSLRSGSVEDCFLRAAMIIERLMMMFRGNQGAMLTAGDKQLIKTLILDGPDAKLREADMNFLANKIEQGRAEYDRDMLSGQGKNMDLQAANERLKGEIAALRRLESGSAFVIKQQCQEEQMLLAELQDSEATIDELEGLLHEYKGVAFELERSGFGMKSELQRLKIVEQHLLGKYDALRREQKMASSGVRRSSAELAAEKQAREEQGHALKDTVAELEAAHTAAEALRVQVNELQSLRKNLKAASAAKELAEDAAEQVRTEKMFLESIQKKDAAEAKLMAVRLTTAATEKSMLQAAAENRESEIAQLNETVVQYAAREEQSNSLVKAMENEMGAVLEGNAKLQATIAELTTTNVALLATEEARQSRLRNEKHAVISTRQALESSKEELELQLAGYEQKNVALAAEVERLNADVAAVRQRPDACEQHELGDGAASSMSAVQLQQLQSELSLQKEAMRLVQAENTELSTNLALVEESRASLKESLEASSETHAQAMDVISQLKSKLKRLDAAKGEAESKAAALEQKLGDAEAAQITAASQPQGEQQAGQAELVAELAALRDALQCAQYEVKTSSEAAEMIADQMVEAREDLERVQGEKLALEEQLASSQNESARIIASAQESSASGLEVMRERIHQLEGELKASSAQVAQAVGREQALEATLVQLHAQNHKLHDAQSAFEAEAAALASSQKDAEDHAALSAKEMAEKIRSLEEKLDASEEARRQSESMIEAERSSSKEFEAFRLKLEAQMNNRSKQIKTLEIELSGTKAAMASMEDDMCEALDEATEVKHQLSVEREKSRVSFTTNETLKEELEEAWGMYEDLLFTGEAGKTPEPQ